MDTLPIATPRQAGIYVRRARERQGLTRAQLAEVAGVSERSLASLELGDATGIRLDKLLAVFNALGIALAAQGEDIGKGTITPSSRRSTRRKLTAKAKAPSQYSATRKLKATCTEDIELEDIPDIYETVFREIAASQGAELAPDAPLPFSSGRRREHHHRQPS